MQAQLQAQMQQHLHTERVRMEQQMIAQLQAERAQMSAHLQAEQARQEAEKVFMKTASELSTVQAE